MQGPRYFPPRHTRPNARAAKRQIAIARVWRYVGFRSVGIRGVSETAGSVFWSGVMS
jgi:hypothetical protein